MVYWVFRATFWSSFILIWYISILIYSIIPKVYLVAQNTYLITGSTHYCDTILTSLVTISLFQFTAYFWKGVLGIVIDHMSYLLWVCIRSTLHAHRRIRHMIHIIVLAYNRCVSTPPSRKLTIWRILPEPLEYYYSSGSSPPHSCIIQPVTQTQCYIYIWANRALQFLL